MTATTEFAFGEAELTLLANTSGKGHFPGAMPPELDEAGWSAVARGLAARGVLRRAQPPVIADDIAALLDVVLFADRSLWLRLMYNPIGGDRAESLWIKGDGVVRQWMEPQDVYHLRACEPAAIEQLLDDVLDLQTEGAAASDPPSTLREADFADALALNTSDGVQAAGARYPEAAGYIEALADARFLASVESSRDIDGGVDRCELTLVESPRHGLWIARNASTGIMPMGETTTLQHVSAESAREQMTALVGTLG